MRSALTLILTACIVTSGFPLSASESDGPIARGISSEARRLAGQDSITVVQGSWQLVTDVTRGAEITMARFGDEQPMHRLFATADGSRLVAINLANPGLPGDVARALRRLATKYPGRLAAVVDRGMNVIDGRVMIGSDGVFVAEHTDRFGDLIQPTKVCDLASVFEPIDRASVRELEVRANRSLSPQRGIVAASLAFLMSVYAVGETRETGCGNNCGAATLLAVGEAFTVPVGLAYLTRPAVHDKLIYRAERRP